MGFTLTEAMVKYSKSKTKQPEKPKKVKLIDYVPSTRDIKVGRCGKKQKQKYDLRSAEYALNRLVALEKKEGRRPGKLGIYICDICGYYHVGHKK